MAKKMDETTRLLMKDEDYCLLSRFGHSVTRLAERYERTEGCPDHLVAAALRISETEIAAEYQRIVLKLRELMGVET